MWGCFVCIYVCATCVLCPIGNPGTASVSILVSDNIELPFHLWAKQTFKLHSVKRSVVHPVINYLAGRGRRTIQRISGWLSFLSSRPAEVNISRSWLKKKKTATPTQPPKWNQMQTSEHNYCFSGHFVVCVRMCFGVVLLREGRSLLEQADLELKLYTRLATDRELASPASWVLRLQAWSAIPSDSF